ncbi:hypothetical protein O9992_19975 [Vibrio lentus]|nr:hypothetical protein [Vibrio lentus]
MDFLTVSLKHRLRILVTPTHNSAHCGRESAPQTHIKVPLILRSLGTKNIR